MSGWRTMDSAPREGDFLAYLANGYITRARLIAGKHFAGDSFGAALGGNNDTTPLYWMPLPEPPNE